MQGGRGQKRRGGALAVDGLAWDGWFDSLEIARAVGNNSSVRGKCAGNSMDATLDSRSIEPETKQSPSARPAAGEGGIPALDLEASIYLDWSVQKVGQSETHHPLDGGTPGTHNIHSVDTTIWEDNFKIYGVIKDTTLYFMKNGIFINWLQFFALLNPDKTSGTVLTGYNRLRQNGTPRPRIVPWKNSTPPLPTTKYTAIAPMSEPAFPPSPHTRWKARRTTS
ncbi:hypothetical protein BU16DRAFT_619710 [Lophium mytilinum]|uniref:Uncharacterized protein n=1 Tax=Lophium mytilinum TaxID=390894 RepID=A0A6A6QLW5_9PEZI|nr:hypothetical protein BU16DRAFT_619710 [Lophium mytilinum]